MNKDIAKQKLRKIIGDSVKGFITESSGLDVALEFLRKWGIFGWPDPYLNLESAVKQNQYVLSVYQQGYVFVPAPHPFILCQNSLISVLFVPKELADKILFLDCMPPKLEEMVS